MSKKVLFITPDFYPNTTGFANACLNLINTINEYGKGKYQTYVYTEEQLLENEEVKSAVVFRRKKIKYNKFTRMCVERKRYNYIKKIIEENEIERVFFETNLFPFLENWILKDYPERIFVRIHSTADTEVPTFYPSKSIGTRITNNQIKTFMEKVPNIITTSNFYIDFIKKYYLSENVYKVWGGKKSYSKIYNTAGDYLKKVETVMENKYITMGKMSSNGIIQKGITDLIVVIYMMRKEKKLPSDFSLLIIGNGDKEVVIRDLVEKYGCADIIHIVGFATHDKVIDYISECKASILLSRYEGQSMFITESIALGKPLIITDENGMSDLVADGENGYTVHAGDIERIIHVFSSFMKLEYQEIQIMGEKSQQIYNEKFSPAHIYEQFDNCMELYGI